MKNYKLHLPEGVKDYIGEEAWLKDEVETQIKKIYKNYRYQLIETPTFEYIDVFAKEEGRYQQADLYKWINKEGEIVALRSDMTRAIARVIATQKETLAMPQKYLYRANNFRYPNRYQGKLHEFTQIGIEVIGEKSIRSDAEVIELAIKALLEVGVKDFALHIGSSDLLDALLDELKINDIDKECIYNQIRDKDAVSVKKTLTQAANGAPLVKLVIDLIQQSGEKELLERLRRNVCTQRTKEAIDKLEGIYEHLTSCGYEKYVLFNMSLLFYEGYYTGMMFHGFTSDIGEEILSGGRYDKLLAAFGKDLPAVGMAMNINLIVQKLLRQNKEGEEGTVC